MTEGSWSAGSPTVDLLMRVSEAFLAGDDQRWLALHEPDCELDLSHYDHWGGEAVYRGHEGLERFRRDWETAFVTDSEDLEQLIELQDGRFLLFASRRRRRRDNDEEIDEAMALIGEIDRGRIKHVTTYSDREEAMRTAGLA
jgi:hypothetical protein